MMDEEIIDELRLSVKKISENFQLIIMSRYILAVMINHAFK